MVDVTFMTELVERIQAEARSGDEVRIALQGQKTESDSTCTQQEWQSNFVFRG
jgi:hypothetical protein